MVVISIVNNKGGVGKSTLACNIAQALAINAQKVLAIDNDNQHNITNMLGLNVGSTTIRDIYLQKNAAAAEKVAKTAIMQSNVEGLHCITAPASLSNEDVYDFSLLGQVLRSTFINDFYDMVIIDNHPGLEKLQMASIAASDYVFIPTLLQQLAVNGLTEMFNFLTGRLSVPKENIRIIPNQFRDLKRQREYLATINDMFPGNVTASYLPHDWVVDELVTEEKILFLDRFRAKITPFFIKLMLELFPFTEDALWEKMMDERKSHLAENARERLRQYKERQAIQ
jgi:chromosome partitioning protein